MTSETDKMLMAELAKAKANNPDRLAKLEELRATIANMWTCSEMRIECENPTDDAADVLDRLIMKAREIGK